MKLGPVAFDLGTEAWSALTGGEAEVTPGPVEISGEGGQLPSRFAAEEIAAACVATALRAAVALDALDSAPMIRLERSHLAEACRSERYFSVDGHRSAVGFAPLSRFWAARDGWVRTHANYPWHRRALLSALGVDPAAVPLEGAVGEAIGELQREELEARVFAAGGVAAAVRTLEEWAAHPQGASVTAEPLVGCEIVGDTRPRPARRRPRVLDLTRVIAGPVATRMLGALGADVLRVDSPRQLDLDPGAFADTLLAKRSCTLDLSSAADAERLHELLDDADVLVQGYRPGALARFGLSPEEIAQRHPGTVVVVIDAWGHEGPWAGRRGFDSVVQAATGLADAEVSTGGEPGALPCQLLDHGTGYLAAAAALDGLRRQRRGGSTPVRRLSLARTAHWVAASTAPAPAQGAAAPSTVGCMVEINAHGHSLGAIAPPGAIGGEPLRWPHAGNGYGADPPSWDFA